jgi:hypothetical protein
LAEKGLHLQSIGNYLVTFEKGDPKKTKYRIEILEESPSQEQLEVYKEWGWELVTNKQIFYIFSSPENSNSTELHIDPMEQSFAFKMISKQIKKNMIVVSIAALLIIAIIAYSIYIEDELYLNLISRNSFTSLMIGIGYIFVCYETMRNYLTVKKIKNSLHKGIPIDHNQKWKLSYVGSSAVYILLISIVLMSIFMPFYTAIRRDIYTSPKATENLPFIKLASVESKEVYDYWHDLNYYWSVLSPVQYSLYEGGYIDGEIQEDFSGAYWKVGLNTRYYQLAFTSMAEGLLKDLIHRYYDSNSDFELVKMEDSKLDLLYVASGENNSLIFAAYNNKVIYMEYSGNENIDRIISLLELKIQSEL